MLRGGMRAFWGRGAAIGFSGLALSVSGAAALSTMSATQDGAKCAQSDAEHVNFWKSAWDKYKADDVRPGFHQEKFHERLLEFKDELLKLRPEDGVPRIFVPLCGKSLDLVFLSQQAKVYGIEVVQAAIDDFEKEQGATYDKQVLSETNGLVHQTSVNGGHTITIGKFDFFNLPPSWSTEKQKFTAAWDRAAFVAIEPKLRQAYAKVLAEQLETGAKMLLVAFDYDQTKRQGPPFSLPEDEIRKVCEPYFKVEVLHRNDSAQLKLKDGTSTTMSENTYLLTRNSVAP